MRILDHDTLFALSALLYMALAGYFWHSRWNITSPKVGQPLTITERTVLALGMSLHGCALYLTMFPAEGMRFSFALAASTMLWFACALYWLEGFRLRLEAIQPVILGPAALGAAIPLLYEKTNIIAHASSLGFRLHFFAAMLAYSLFALAFLQAILLRIAERKLHKHDISPNMIALPPLLALEGLLFRMISIAFVLLTFAIVSGTLFSEELYGRVWRFDHKTVFALLSWGIFAGLIIGRIRAGWRGKVAQRWLMTGFTALVLAYVGSHFVSEVLLGK